MPKITFIESNGITHLVDVAVGASVMTGARDGNVPGIDADCGGACSCATCHVHVAPDWIASLPTVGVLESEMLDCAIGLDETSRLSCQIAMTDALDGLVVHIPASQHG